MSSFSIYDSIIDRYFTRVTCVVEGEHKSLKHVPGLKNLDEIDNLIEYLFETDSEPALLTIHACTLLDSCPKLLTALVDCDERAVYFVGCGTSGMMIFKATGDVLVTHRSHAHLEHREGKVIYSPRRLHEVADNLRTIGNTTLTFKPAKPFSSINCSRNGAYGKYPHDDIFLYVAHVAACIYQERYTPGVDFEVYEPLREVLTNDSLDFFRLFEDTDGFLKSYYLDALRTEDGSIVNTYFMSWQNYTEFAMAFSVKRGNQLLNALKNVA